MKWKQRSDFGSARQSGWDAFKAGRKYAADLAHTMSSRSTESRATGDSEGRDEIQRSEASRKVAADSSDAATHGRLMQRHSDIAAQ